MVSGVAAGDRGNAVCPLVEGGPAGVRGTVWRLNLKSP